MRPNFLLLILIPFLICGCQKQSHERHYEEIAIAAPAKAPFMEGDPHAGLDLDIPILKKQSNDSGLVWETPSEWREEAASGMRVATFKSAADPDEIDVSIVSLAGDAGGLESNLARWATQIGLKLAIDQDLPKLIDQAALLKTAGGIEARIFDFSILQQGAASSTKSTLAAIIEMTDGTVFVKMTGSISAIQKNLEAFRQLTQSVKKP